jgi:hypothetical protein
MAENDQLTAENARLRSLLNPDAAKARIETEQQMQALKGGKRCSQATALRFGVVA